MYALETADLERSFRGHRVIDGLNLHVGKGEIYGFIGRNGAGKSTTMRMIAGLLAPQAGQIRIFGQALTPCEANPALGTLIENPGLYPNLSAFDNLMTKALVLGVVNASKRCRELLNLVGLDGSKKRVKGFSMGMRQRLGVAMALLGNPEILILDEPLNGLDPEGAREIRQLLSRLNRDRGITVLVSSHVLDQLERMCTCYGVICGGRMVRELTAQEVEQECASYLALSCLEPERAFAILTERFPQFTASVLPDNSLHITGDIEASDVGRVLAEEGIVIQELHRTEGDIEDFFVQLMGGDDSKQAAHVSTSGHIPNHFVKGGDAR